MNQKALKKRKNKNKNKNTNSRRSGLPVVEEEVIEEELTFGDKLLANITPYLGTILFALVAGFLLFALAAFLWRSGADAKSFEWRELSSASSIARQTGNISEWTRVAEKYPDSKAGLWASQFAGDYQLREGLSTLTKDQKAGFGMIEKSKTYFQSVIDAPDSAKTATLKQRSHFSLAYAHESLGQFAESKALYEKLIKEAPNSSFAAVARRGLNRSTNGDYTDLYAKFANWEEEMIGEAPGPRVPDGRPTIDFPDVDLPPGEKPPTTSGVMPAAQGDGSEMKVVTEAPKVVTEAPPEISTPAAGEAAVAEKMTSAAENSAVEVKPVGTVEAKPAQVESTPAQVEATPAQSMIAETVEKVAAPVANKVTEGATAVTEGATAVTGSLEPAAGVVKEAAEAVTDAVKEAIVPPTK